jgi:WD40 repeat protein
LTACLVLTTTISLHGEPPANAFEADRPVRRDRYGDPLPEEAASRLGTIRLRHAHGTIGFLRFTPDGKTLVAEGSDGIRTWEVATGQQLHSFPRGWIGWHPEGPSLSPDGNLVALRDLPGVRLGEVGSGKQVRAFGTGRFAYVRFSPDGNIVAALGCEDINSDRIDQVQLWDVTTGKQVRSWRLDIPLSPSSSAAYAACGKLLVAAREDGMIGFWDVTMGKQVRQVPVAVRRLAVSPDGMVLAGLSKETGRPENNLYLWDVASGKELRQWTLPVKKNDVPGSRLLMILAFAPDGKALFTASWDGTVIAWDPATGEELRRFAGNIPNPYALAIAPDNRHLAVATGAKIRLIDLTSGMDRFRAVGHAHGIGALAVTSDGRTVATADGGDRSIVLWDPETGQERRRIEGRRCVTAIRIKTDGQTMLASTLERELRAWDLSTGRELPRLESPGEPFKLLALSPDGKTLAMGGVDGTVAVRDATTGKERRNLKGHSDIVFGATYSADSRTLITWDHDNEVRVWDVTSGRKLRQFVFLDRNGVGGTYVAAVSPDGRTMAFGSRHSFLAFYDWTTGQEIRRLVWLPDGVVTLAFSPDGRALAWGGYRDPSVHLVELATDRERHRFVNHRGEVTSLTFSTDGRTLISGHSDTTALVWDLTGRLAAKGLWGQPLSSGDLAACWSDLAGSDAARAYQTVRRLAASPTEAVPYLRTRLSPVPAADEKRLARLITDLDSDNFAMRESASKELERLGEGVAGFCRKALAGTPSREVRRCLEALLAAQGEAWRAPDPGRLRMLRALEVLEQTGTPEALRLLVALAKGAAEARLTQEANASLRRLARRPSVMP